LRHSVDVHILHTRLLRESDNVKSWQKNSRSTRQNNATDRIIRRNRLR